MASNEEILAGTIPDIQAAVAEIDDEAQLQSLLEDERSGRGRVGVINLLEAKLDGEEAESGEEAPSGTAIDPALARTGLNPDNPGDFNRQFDIDPDQTDYPRSYEQAVASEDNPNVWRAPEHIPTRMED